MIWASGFSTKQSVSSTVRKFKNQPRTAFHFISFPFFITLLSVYFTLRRCDNTCCIRLVSTSRRNKDQGNTIIPKRVALVGRDLRPQPVLRDYMPLAPENGDLLDSVATISSRRLQANSSVRGPELQAG